MKITIDTERLIKCRREAGITQSEAASIIGVSQPAYQRYEAGLRAPSVQVVKEMANAYNVSFDYLIGESDRSNPDCIIINKNVNPLLFSIVDNFKDLNTAELKRLREYIKKLS